MPPGPDPRGVGQAAGPVARTSWAEAVLRDLRLIVATGDTGIAASVVASLDERGYLTENVPELARIAGAEVTAVERVVRILREIGPPGIGARDLRDCLLLQLDRLTANGVAHPVARAVVADHLEALARGPPRRSRASLACRPKRWRTHARSSAVSCYPARPSTVSRTRTARR